MNNRLSFIKKQWPVVFIFVLWIAFSFPYFFQHKVPYPSTYQVNFFSPWSRYSEYASPVKNNAMPDVIDQIYPWKYYSIMQLKKGEFPFWNPYSFSGNPHLANYQTAIFSPFTLLYFILPFIDAWSITILLQPLLAGLFTYLYMQKVKASKGAGLIASIVFMFSGFMVVWMAYGTLGMAIAVLPLILYCIELFFDKVSLSSLVGISAAVAFSFVSGHFQTSIYVLGVSVVYVVWKTVVEKAYKKGFWGAFYILLGVLFAMPQILPSLEFFQNAPRSIYQVGSSGIPFYNLITIIAPDFFGNPVTRNNLFLDFAEWQAYIGAAAFFLSVWAISFSKKIHIKQFFFVCGLTAVIFAVASPLQSLVGALHIPVLSSSTQSRIITIFSFCFSLLAGFGFDDLQKAVKDKKIKFVMTRISIVLLTITVVWIILLFGKYTPGEITQIAKKNFILPSAILFFVSVVTFGSIYIKKKYILIVLQIIFISIITFESFRYVTKWMPFDPRELVFPQTNITDVIQKNIGTGRIYGGIGQQTAVYYKLPVVEGYDPLYIQRYGQLVTSSINGSYADTGGRTVEIDKRNKNTDRLLNVLGVSLIFHPVADTNASWAYPVWSKKQMKVVYADPIHTIYRNTDGFARAKMFYTFEIISQKEAMIKRFYENSFDYKHTLLLEESGHLKSMKNTQNSVNIIQYDANKVTIQVQTKNNGMLFLSDPYYPGWNATLDGKETKIYRADYAFRAVSVPAGLHTVTFFYNPGSFYIGIFFAGIGLLGIFSFWVFSKPLKGSKKLLQ